MVTGPRHHALYAHPRQCSEKEQSGLWPGAIYLSAREQQLPLSCRRATELRWVEHSQSSPCLHRQRQTLRSMLPKGATAEKESGSVVRGTQEPDRTASSEIAPDAVRARTIPPGGYGTKSQTAGAVP